MKIEFEKGDHSLIPKILHKSGKFRSYLINFLDYYKSKHNFCYNEPSVYEYIINCDYIICSSSDSGCFFAAVQNKKYYYDNFTNLSKIFAYDVKFWEKQNLSNKEHFLFKDKLINQKIKKMHDNISSYKEFKFNTEVNLWFSINEYWHWFNEELPKLEIIKKNNYPILVNRLCDWQRESLKCFPDILNRLVEIDTPCCISALSFRAYSSPSTPYKGRTSAWVAHFLNKNFLSTSNFRPTDKVYISRNDSVARCVENEEEVLEFMCSRGFIIYKDFSKKTLQEKLDIFRKSKIIVSPTGSNLTHCHAMLPGSILLDFNHSFQLEEEYAWNNIGAELGINWYSFPAITGSIGLRSLDGQIKKNNHLIVDIKKFKKNVSFIEKLASNE